MPSRYNSSRAKCIKCSFCAVFFSPNKFVFHSHRLLTDTDKYIQPDAANFNSWRRHTKLLGDPPEVIMAVISIVIVLSKFPCKEDWSIQVLFHRRLLLLGRM